MLADHSLLGASKATSTPMNPCDVSSPRSSCRSAASRSASIVLNGTSIVTATVAWTLTAQGMRGQGCSGRRKGSSLGVEYPAPPLAAATPRVDGPLRLTGSVIVVGRAVAVVGFVLVVLVVLIA